MIECSISNLGKVVTGKTPSTKNSLFWEGDIPFITPKDIQKTKHIFDTERNLTFEGMKSVKNCVLPENAICVSCIGNIGYVAKTTSPAVTNQQINSIIVNDANNSDYVYYLMRSLWQRFKNYEGQSTTLSILNKRQFSEIKILIHEDKSVQTKIANVLSSLDNKIELNEKINQNLEAQAQAIFKSWFVDFEPFKNGKFIDSELGKIPEGWRVEKLGQILNIRYGKNLPQTKLKISGYPVYGANGQIGFYSEYMFKSPQVLVSCRGAASGKVNISTKNSFITNNSLILDYTTSKTLSFEYLKYYALRADFSPFVTGSAQPQITIETISSAKILVPNKQIMNKFNLTIFPILNAIFKNNEESCYLSQLRDTLLPKLMSGEIDVSDVAV